ncbi:MAG: hypothetical protein NT013_01435 [Planctomycetia bacterium]|nr:hypothetical protein [Planctomycetia bacterium]
MSEINLKPAIRKSYWQFFAIGVAVLGVTLWLLESWLREPELVPVTGQIQYDGKPLSNGFVVSIPTRGGLSALSALDDEGRFDLSTNGVPGASVGTHRLTVQAYTREMPPRPRIPAKFGSVDQTPLRLSVKKSAANHFDFQLDESLKFAPNDTGLNPN